MTDQELIIEVAKLDGWEQRECFEQSFSDPMGQVSVGLRWCRGSTIARRLPDYLESRDAIVPVIEKQGPIARVQLIDFLCEYKFEHYDGGDQMSQSDAAELIISTPRQLCIALLKATGKYK